MDSSNKNSLTQTISKTIDKEYTLPKNIGEFAKAKYEPKQEVKEVEVKRSKSLLKASRAINRLFSINLMKEQNIFSKIIALKRTTTFDNLILEKSATSASRLEVPKQF